MSEYYDPRTYPKQWNYLQTGTMVDNYIIERELAHGGFSSVYLAREKVTQVQVALKEYLPRKLAHRTWNNEIVANSEDSKKLIAHGRTLFIDEAKVLAKLKHPNIVEVVNFFQANATVYIVMVYGYGITLDKLLKNKIITIDDQWLIKVFGALCSLKKFVINGIVANSCDFVDNYDHSPETVEDYSCGNMQADIIPATSDVLEKYKITIDEYKEIADKVAEEVSFGCCDWCA